MRKLLLIVVALQVCIAATAQRLDSAINHVFEPLDKSQITTGLLIDKAYCTQNPLNFDGTSASDTLKNYLQWYSLYSTMGTAEVDSTIDVLPATDAWKSVAENLKNSGTIPIPILHLEYNQFISDSVALASLIYVQDGQIYDAVNQNISPYQQKTVFGAALYSNPKENVLDVKVRIPSQLYFNNTGKTIQSVTIDFDDGSGAQNVNLDQDFVVNYGSFGTKKLEITVGYTDQTSYQCKTELQLVDKSGGTSAMGMFGYDDTPDEEIEISSGRSADLGATLQIEYACGPQKLDKPLIIVEGFNPNDFNELDYGDFWEIIGFYQVHYQSAPLEDPIVSMLEGNGYDIVYVDFEYGAGDVVENSYVLMEVLNKVNEIKAENNSVEKNIVWGPSMGGVIARYALCTMEQEGTPHDVSYYYSDDAPHLGANILLGFQYLIKDMYHYCILDQRPGREAVEPMYKVLALPATKQLLRLHAYNDDDPMQEHTQLQAELAAMGLPSQTEANIAMSRGNGNGTAQEIPAGGNLFTVNVNSFNVLSTLNLASPEWSWIAGFAGAFELMTQGPVGAIAEVKINVNAISEHSAGNEIIYERKVRALLELPVPSWVPFVNSIPIPEWDDTQETIHTYAYDSSPGGYFNFASDDEGDNLLSDINDYQPNISLNYTQFNFVPTFSALNMTSYENDPFASIDTETIITNGETNFDRAFIRDPSLYTTANIEDNEAHAEQTPSSVRAFQAFTLNFVEMELPGDEVIG